MKQLDSNTRVSPQIRPADLPGLAAAGVVTVVNNRPDGEEPGQPTSAEIEAAAQAAGLNYRYIPIAGGFSQAEVEAMAEALEAGPVLAFCKSGTRSTFLWALAEAQRGADPEALAAKAAAAGYDLTPIRRYLGG
ncbi:MAG: TIGR01244 family sulfur transferase [Allosphingosinicella sp.]